MAVPKKKRYKEIVKNRHSLEKLSFFRKNQIAMSKFKNYANISPNYKNATYCGICNSAKIDKQLCARCYVFYFVNFFAKKIKFSNKKIIQKI